MWICYTILWIFVNFGYIQNYCSTIHVLNPKIYNRWQRGFEIAFLCWLLCALTLLESCSYQLWFLREANYSFLWNWWESKRCAKTLSKRFIINKPPAIYRAIYLAKNLCYVITCVSFVLIVLIFMQVFLWKWVEWAGLFSLPYFLR